jgi:serine phosphatase RsbU (regulator of sigma subunit)
MTRQSEGMHVGAARDVLVRETQRPTAGSADASHLPLARGLRHAIALLLLLGAFIADLDTGYDLSSSLFYIVPVAFTAWFVGRRQGLVAAVASSMTWYVSQRLAGVALSRPGILYANAGVECLIYLGAAWAVARVHADRIAERRLSARVTAANEALEREFTAVGELQRGLLPKELPRVDGYEWDVHYATSTRAGGDYYDAFPLPDGGIGVIVADASGHGAPAAVLMGMTRALLGSDPESPLPPDEALARLNRQLERVLPLGWFVTACYVVIDPARGRFTYSLAGHDPPLVVRARNGAVEQLPGRGGLPLGPFKNRRYEAGWGELEPGDTLVLFTDGVIETRSPARELFGVERLREALAGTATAKLVDAKLRLLDCMARHAAGARTEDDTTIGDGPHVMVSEVGGSRHYRRKRPLCLSPSTRARAPRGPASRPCARRS